MKKSILLEYEQRFQTPASVLVRAPGRVNLIGEHTDYNEGYVLPMAIDRSVQIALASRPDRKVVIHSLEYGETLEFGLDDLERGKGWLEYIKGAAWALEQKKGKLTGWNGLITGDIPRGAGLSSSSAVVVAAMLAFESASGLEPDPVEIALLAHHAEDGWIGVHGGIMDQMVSLLSLREHALFLDCRTLKTKQIPLPKGMTVAILDTSTRRGLVDSAYNQRRDECDAAALALGVRTLRDISEREFRTRSGSLDEVLRRRARHVITENTRVLEAVEALQRGDVVTMGHLLDASHASLRDDFEVSNKALDTIVTIARQYPGCYGARMTGAGFGGCAVALLGQVSEEGFSSSIAEKYHQETGLTPEISLCKAAGGAKTTYLVEKKG